MIYWAWGTFWSITTLHLCGHMMHFLGLTAQHKSIAYQICLICHTKWQTLDIHQHFITLHDKSESSWQIRYYDSNSQTSLVAADGRVVDSRIMPLLQHCDAFVGNPLPRKATELCLQFSFVSISSLAVKHSTSFRSAVTIHYHIIQRFHYAQSMVASKQNPIL